MGWDDSFQVVITLPSGATTGQRIVLDSTTDEIDIYNASNQLVTKISPAGIQVISDDGTVYALLDSGQLQFGTTGFTPFFPTVINGQESQALIEIQSGLPTGNETQAHLLIGSSGTGFGNSPYVNVSADGAVNGPLLFNIDGILQTENMAWGSVAITPSAANTPTSHTVTGLGLQGTTAKAQVTAATTVPGTQVTGVAASSITPDGLTVWLTRTNTTATTVDWLVISQP